MPRTPAEGDYSAPQTPLAGLKFGSKLRVEFKLSTVYQQCTELSYVKKSSAHRLTKLNTILYA